MDEERDEATYEGAERQTGLRQDARTLGMAAQLKQQAATDMILTARAQAAVAQSANDLEAFVEDAQLVLDEVYMELEKQCDEAQRRMATIREARKILTDSFGRSSTLVHERLGNAFTEISLDQLPQSLAPRQQPAAAPAAAQDPRAAQDKEAANVAGEAQAEATQGRPEPQAGERAEDAPQQTPTPEPAAVAAEADGGGEEPAEGVAPQANVGKKALMDVFGAPDEGGSGEEADARAEETADQGPAPKADDVDENLPEEEQPDAAAEEDVPVAPAAQATAEAVDDLDEPDGIGQAEQATSILPEIERGQGLTLEQVLTTLVGSDVNAATMRAYGLDARLADEVVRARRR